MRRRLNQLHRERIAVRILIVGQHAVGGRDAQRFVAEHAVAVGHRDGSVVEAGDRDGDGREIRVKEAVVGSIRELVGAEEVRIGLVREGTRRRELQGSVTGRIGQQCRQRIAFLVVGRWPARPGRPSRSTRRPRRRGSCRPPRRAVP